MKRLPVPLAIAMVIATLVIVGCAPAGPAPTPTRAPAAPTKAAEPTKAPAAPTKAAEPTKPAAAQPTAAPAKKVDFPQKGKSVSVTVTTGAGGSVDMSTRALAAFMEKELGVPFEVSNKTGAAGQVGFTELAQARPDGYSLATTSLPSILTTYLDPERKAAYTRDSFQPVGMYVADPMVLAVRTDSPFKSVKELVDGVKANPDKIKVASATGAGGPPHLAILLLEKAASTKFATVLFPDAGQTSMTAMLGGHVDAVVAPGGNFGAHVRSGAMRILGVMDRQESPFFQGVKTFTAQGYDVHMVVYYGLSAPARTPIEIVNIHSAAIKKMLDSGEMKSKLDPLGMEGRYAGPAQFAQQWTEVEALVKPLIPLLKQ